LDEELPRSTVPATVEFSRSRGGDAREVGFARGKRAPLKRLDGTLEITTLLKYRPERVPDV